MKRPFPNTVNLDLTAVRALRFLRTQTSQKYNLSKITRDKILADAAEQGFPAEEGKLCFKCWHGQLQLHSIDANPLSDRLKCPGCDATETRVVWAKLRQDSQEAPSE